MLKVFVILSLFVGALTVQAQQNAANKESTTKVKSKSDSTKTKTSLDSVKLKEVVVTADNIRFEDGKVVMTPTKQAKNLAKDISSLIENMNTGILTVDNDIIKTSSGHTVSLFINGEPVNKFDQATFWAKNVLKVEYIPNSDDPKFLGNSHIINLVMKEYAAGGLTRLNGYQMFPNLGNYSAASKLVIGRMTYNAMFKGEYSRDHISNDNRTENYRNVWYDGVEYDNISRAEETSSVNRENMIYTGFDARYRTEKTTIAHTFGFNWKRNPESHDIGSVLYSPNIIAGNKMNRTVSSKNYSYELTGIYLYKFTKASALQFKWVLNYSNNASLSTYSEKDAGKIVTDIDETVKGCLFSLLYFRKFSEKFTSNIFLDERIISYNTLYSGTTGSLQKQTEYNSNVRGYFYYQPIEPLTFSIKPQLTIFSRNINNNYKKTDWLPIIDFQSYYTINNKSSAYMGMYYYLMTPRASQYNDLILRQTELKWIEGTPSIKPSNYYYFYAGYSFVPVKWYTLTLNTSYTIQNNQSYLSYRSGGKDYDGVIGKYLNGVDENCLA